jgi:hypothetical protein
MAEILHFVLRFDDSANEVNKRPNLKGQYQVAGEVTPEHELSLWGGVGQNNALYARGKATPASASAAIRARAAPKNAAGPPGIDLKVGEAVIFQNDKEKKIARAREELDPEGKALPGAIAAIRSQPDFYGYVREPNRYIKLAGWEHGRVITGTAEPWRPGPMDAAIPKEQPLPKA